MTRAVIASLVLLLAPRAAAPQLPVTEVRGTVLAGDDRTPLAAVTVSAWSGGRLVARTTTDQRGEYALKLDTGRPVDILYYDRRGWPLQQVDHLSGTRGHVINKLLYSTNPQSLPLLPALGALSAYESLYYVSGRLEQLDGETIGRARELLRTLLVPDALIPRLQQVQALWNVGR